MALHTITPAESVLAQFSSEEASRIGASAISNFSKLEAENHNLFHYHLPSYAKRKLSERGFYLSPFSYETHSHPVSKTIESHLINIKLPNYINEDFLIVGIKDNKLGVLRKEKKLRFLEAVNRCVTSHDIQRYGPSFHFEKAKANWKTDFSGINLSAGVQSLLPRVIFDKGKTQDAQIFLYDELHYWSMRDIVDFLEISKAKTVIGSFVFPVEVLAGSDKSLNPWAYDFKIEGDKLIYAPDGVWAESYEQPLSSGQLLRYNKIITQEGIYSVQVRDSIFSHCLVIINRDNLVTEEYRTFSDFDAISIRKLNYLGGNSDDIIPIRHEVILSVFKYIRTLKKPDLQSGMAKHRQLVDDPSGFEIRFIEDFVQFILENHERFNLIGQKFSNFFSAACIEMLPRYLQRFFSSFKGYSLGKFIEEIEPLKFTLRCRTYSRFSFKMSYMDEEIQKDGEGDPIIPLTKSGRRSIARSYPDFFFHALTSIFSNPNPKLVKRIVYLFISAWVGKTDEDYYTSLLFLRKSLSQKGPKLFLLHDDRFSSLILLANSMDSYNFKATLKNEVSRRLRLAGSLRGLISYCPISENPEGKKDLRIRNCMSKVVKELLEISIECHPISTLTQNKCYQQELINLKRHFISPLPLSKRVKIMPLPVVKKEKKMITVEDQPEIQTSANEGELEVEHSSEQPQYVIPARTGTKEVSGSNDSKDGNPIVAVSSDSFISSIIKTGPFNEADVIEFVRNLSFSDSHIHAGRQSIFFSKGDFSYGFNSTTYKSSGWPSVFNDLYGDRFNSCLVQKYGKDARLGLHKDDEACYDETHEVMTINLFGNATLIFTSDASNGLEKQDPCKFLELSLAHGEYLLMPHGFQMKFKHGVKTTSAGRISLTFRKQARTLAGVNLLIPTSKGGEDGSDESENSYYEEMNKCSISAAPNSVKCNLSIFPVKADGDCFWHAVSSIFGLEAMELKGLIRERAINEGCVDPLRLKEFVHEMEPKVYASNSSLTATCFLMNIKLIIKLTGMDEEGWVVVEPLSSSNEKITLGYLVLNQKTHHFDLAVPKEGCVIRAVSEFLKQNPTKVLSVLSANCSKELLHELMSGLGIQEFFLEEIFSIFDICAEVSDGETSRTLNKKGSRSAKFIVDHDHFSYCPGVKASTNLGAFKAPSGSQMIPTEKYEFFLKGNANIVAFTPSLPAAKKLANSFLSGQTGVINSKIISGQYDWLADTNKLCFEERKIGAIVGTFGSGKSHNVVELLRHNLGYQNLIISPRRSLKEQFINLLDLVKARSKGKKTSTEVATFEVALKKTGLLKKVRIFIDEAQLLPPGYLDLICLISGSDSSILVMGDPAQSSYDSADDRMAFVGDEGCLDVLLKGKRYVYLSESKRFRNPMFVGRLPCTFDSSRLTLEKEEYAVFSSFKDFKNDYLSPKIKTFLVSSFTEKTVVKANMGRNVMVYTFGESTGMNFDYTCVLLTQDSMLVDERRWVVALSRAKVNMSFVNLSGLSLSEFCTQMVGGVVHKFFTGTATFNDLRDLLPGDPIFSKKFQRLGSDEIDREARLAGDPWLKTKVFLGQREVKAEEEIIPKEELQNIKVKVHCPISSIGSTFADIQSKLKAKEVREKRIDSIVTEQFSETHKGKGKIMTAAPDNFEAIYPRHKAGDTATFVMAARKRLKFSRPANERQKFMSAIPYGDTMLKVFLEKVKLKPNFDHRLFEEARNDFEEKKLQKSMATLENHSGRSDPDWAVEKALIFMKSQLCTKFDNRFRDAKAGQTLACFHHNVLCRLAPYIRYIEKKVFAALPKNLYIHSGKNFDDLRDWVIAHKFSGVCTESDYEAFDSSQDANILAFEVSLMNYLNLPRDLIEDYKHLKFNTHSKLGQFAVMRFTGEAGTFLFNTLANMVFTFMRYETNGREAICFAGDDMCANKLLRRKSEFEHVLERMTLKAKVQHTNEPTFCGWRLGLFGIIKRPQLVQERILIALEKGNFNECIDNYAIEVSYAYNLGERLVSIMSEKELDAHYFCVRTFLQHKNLFNSNAAEFFSESESCSSPERNFG
uniref:Replicase n=1 Tax=Cherry twisted leaf associated virus TaxID=1424279 RepID=V5LXA9_9VIRU|nr:replicase [Cherry twisted leaf associated virus]